MRKFAKTFQNPFLLVGQGFVLGALLFFGAQKEVADARAHQAAEKASILDVVKARF